MIRSATEDLDNAADDLERNAAEQLQASDAGADAKATSGTPIQAPASSMESIRSDPGPPPFGDPLPSRTESWEIGGALAAGLGVSGTARFTVMELSDGRSIIWLEDVDAATASVGASVDLGMDGGPGLELGADASSKLAVHTSDAWYVDSAGVPGLLARLGLREFTGAGTLSPGVPGVPGLPGDSGGGFGFVLEGVADLMGLGAPEPAVTEKLITLGGTAGISAAVGIPLVGASGAVADSVGTRERGGDLSLVVRTSADYATKIPGGGPSGGESIEFEIPVGAEAEGHMVVTTTEKVAGGERLERAVYGFDSDRARVHAGDAVRAVGSGDLEGAADALAALWENVELRPIWSDAMGGVVNNDVKTLDVGVALGADLSGSVTGGRRIVTYQR